MTTATAPMGAATNSAAYQELLKRCRHIGALASIDALARWDQETKMPEKAAPWRAEQLSVLARLTHDAATDPRLGELIAKCEQDKSLLADPDAAANIRELRRDFDRATKLPGDLVAEQSRTSSEALHVWKTARQKNDFRAFQPWLQKQVDLARRRAECYGAPKGGELYDALIDDFEPGVTSAEIDRIFKPLREAISSLIGELGARPGAADGVPKSFAAPLDKQRAFVDFVAERIGYDLQAGRIDVSTHPFSETVGAQDNRITTRYADDNFTDALFTTLHECGHAMYEQGLPPEKFGTPLGSYISLGIHESQSRMIENQVGRSRPFWQWLLPEAQRMLGGALSSTTVDQAHRAVNTVRPHFIRVESDESTYNLHIMLRFDIEKALLRGDMTVADVPGYWKERLKKDLNLDVPDDRRGCLQDIHWSMGSFGYFPTYTLGNLHAAQMWETINQQIPDLEDQFARGEFQALLQWLRANVHQHGKRLRAAELCRKITGKPLSHEPLVNYLQSKLRGLYAG